MIDLPVQKSFRLIAVLPTRYGYIFSVLLFTLLIGSINNNSNLGYLLTFFLGNVALVSVIHTLRNISAITLSGVRAEPVFAGQKCIFEVNLLPLSQNRSSISFNFTDSEKVTVDLLRAVPQKVNVDYPVARRGLQKPGVLRISSNYPLGLFETRATSQLDASCLVYPKPIPGPLITAHGIYDEQGEAGDSGGFGADDFAGLEVYRIGDPLQRIYWKAYSRGQGMHTKQFEGIKGKTLHFDLEIMPGDDLEYKLSRICHMVLTAEDMRITYGLKLGRTLISPGSGDSHKRLCLRALALAGQEE